MNEIAAIGWHAALPAADPLVGATEPARIGREFDAMLLRMLCRTAAVPGAGRSAQSPLAAALADVYLPQLATQHSTGFGALVLSTLGADHAPRPLSAARAALPRSN